MKHLNYISLLAAGFILAAFPQPGRAFSIATTGSVDHKGNGLASDSYDSSDPNYSTNGLYHPYKRKAGGDILVYGGFTNSVLSVGSLYVAGHLITGPFGAVDIGNGSVGSLAWIDANMMGIEPGYLFNDTNILFHNVELPSGSWIPSGPVGSPYGGSGTAPNGITYDHVFLLPGNYVVSDNGSIYVATNTTVTIQATSATFQPDRIYVAGTGYTAGKLITYLTGTKAVLGTEHRPQNGNPVNLQFFGLPSLTNLSYGGNGNFTGVIYAPQADFSLNGGGNDIVDFIGLTVAKSIKLNGHYKFHFDENLSRIFPFASPIFIYPPQIYPPQNWPVRTGLNVTFTIWAISALPLTYQWNYLPLGASSSIPIPNATNNTVTIANVTLENQGHYFAVVSNAMVSASSPSALLAVYSETVLSQPFRPAAGQIQFNVVGTAGAKHIVQASTNLVAWFPVVTNVIPFTFVETNAGSIPTRFYRAVWAP